MSLYKFKSGEGRSSYYTLPFAESRWSRVVRFAFKPALLVQVATGLLLFGCGSSATTTTTPRSVPDPLAQVRGEELFRTGTELARSADYIRAEQYFVAAVHRGYPERQVMPHLLRACVSSSRIAAALGYAEPYLTRHPSEWRLRLLVASFRLALGNAEQSRIELERVLHDAPSEPPRAHYLLALVHRDEIHDENAARVHFSRYLELSPNGEHAEEARASLRTLEVSRSRPESPQLRPERMPTLGLRSSDSP